MRRTKTLDAVPAPARGRRFVPAATITARTTANVSEKKEADENDDGCPIIARAMRDADLDAVLEHRLRESAFCLDCTKQFIRHHTGEDRPELLYADGPPPWVLEKQDEERQQREQDELAKKAREKINSKASAKPKEAELELDGLLLNRLKNSGYSKPEAALKMVELRREQRDQRLSKQQEEKNKAQPQEQASGDNVEAESAADSGGQKDLSKQKNERVNASEMPWRPTPVEQQQIGGFGRASLLKFVDQRRYAAICAQSMVWASRGALRYEANKLEIRAWDERLAEEREAFEECAFQVLLKGFGRSDTSSRYDAFFELPPLHNYWKSRWQSRPEKSTAYQMAPDRSVVELDWTSAYDVQHFVARKAPQLYGVLTGFAQSGIRFPAGTNRDGPAADATPAERHSEMRTLVDATRLGESLAVRGPDDAKATALSLAAARGAQLVMESSAARALFAGASPHNPARVLIPVQVVERLAQGVQTTLYVLGKPIPVEMSAAALRRFVAKRALRFLFEKPLEPTRKRRAGARKSAPSKNVATEGGETTSPSPSKKKAGPEKLATLGALQIVEEDEEEEVEPGPSTSRSEGPAVDDGDDLLGRILQQSDDTEESEFLVKNDENDDEDVRKQHVYNVFRFDGLVAPVIVRARAAPVVEKLGGTCSASAKMEFIPEAGAEILTTDEWAWHFATALFRGTHAHALVRVHATNWHCLAVEEHRTADWPRRSNALAPGGDEDPEVAERQALVSERVLRFGRLLEALRSLPVGRFLIDCRPADGTLRIQPEEAQFGGQTLHALAASARYGRLADETGRVEDARTKRKAPGSGAQQSREAKAWRGLDPYIVLQWQLINGRAPLCFMPADYSGKKAVGGGQQQQQGSRQQDGGGASRKNRKRARNRAAGGDKKEGGEALMIVDGDDGD